MTQTPDVSDEHHKFQLRSRAARMLSLVELPIGNLTSDMNYQVCVKQESVCYMSEYSPIGAVSTHFLYVPIALTLCCTLLLLLLLLLCLCLCLCEK